MAMTGGFLGFSEKNLEVFSCQSFFDNCERHPDGHHFRGVAEMAGTGCFSGFSGKTRRGSLRRRAVGSRSKRSRQREHRLTLRKEEA